MFFKKFKTVVHTLLKLPDMHTNVYDKSSKYNSVNYVFSVLLSLL